MAENANQNKGLQPQARAPGYEDVMNLASRRGYFLRSADSYPNTPAGFWDYGPLGTLFKNRYVELWRRMIVKRDEMVELDTSEVLPRAVFVASGHVGNFSDPIVECSNCHSIYRVDKLIEEKVRRAVPEGLPDIEYDALLAENNIVCSNCKNALKGTRRFNMMFRVGIGPQGEEAYLRPETCQGIFVDIPVLFKTQRIKLPRGFAQLGKSFRNEIAPRQGILRQREFYQAEVEVLFNPERVDLPRFDVALEYSLNISAGDVEPTLIKVSEAISRGVVPNKLIGYYLYLIQSFYESLGLRTERIRLRSLTRQEKAFYSAVAFDLEVKTSVGWLELVACNYRSDYDLRQHAEASKTDFTVEDDGKKVLPHIFELSMGVGRSLYALLDEAYRVDDTRTYLALLPRVAPIQVGVFPLMSKEGLPEKARAIYDLLRYDLDAMYDETGSIGRRYARSDEAGIPFCVTVDQETMKQGTVTVRERDSKMQSVVPAEQLQAWLKTRLS
ncbi:MAG: glycine--tRNA ligase [Nitrososphaerota archaeon]|nr:glycine--tRNA ligase [Nitrososphaerota archaeon]